MRHSKWWVSAKIQLTPEWGRGCSQLLGNRSHPFPKSYKWSEEGTPLLDKEYLERIWTLDIHFYLCQPVAVWFLVGIQGALEGMAKRRCTSLWGIRACPSPCRPPFRTEDSRPWDRAVGIQTWDSRFLFRPFSAPSVAGSQGGFLGILECLDVAAWVASHWPTRPRCLWRRGRDKCEAPFCCSEAGWKWLPP